MSVSVNHEREAAGLKPIKFAEDEVLLVYFTKTLKNWKAIVITTLPDQRMYEVTQNGEKNETYVDVYDKAGQFVYPSEDPDE